MADDLDSLFAESAGDDAYWAQVRANKGAKQPVFHAGETRDFTPFKDLWNAAAADMGITTKRMRNDALAAAAADEAVWRDTSSALSAEIGRSRELVRTPEDAATLRGLETQLDVIGRMRDSSDPMMQNAAKELFVKVNDDLRGFGQKQEGERIAREASVAQQERELGTERWSRFSSAYDDLHRESSDFLTIQSSFRALQASYAGDGEPGNFNDIAATNSIQRMIDPGVSVREGDVSLLMNYAGIPEWMVTAANRVAKDGGRYTPEERAGLLELGKTLMVAANQKQAETNVRFQGLGQAAELPEQYVGKLAIPLVDTGGDEASALNFGTPRPAVPTEATVTGEETPAGVLRDTASGLGDIYQGLRDRASATFEALDKLNDPPQPDWNSYRPRRVTGGRFGADRAPELARRRPRND